MNNRKNFLRMGYYDTYSNVTFVHDAVVNSTIVTKWYDGFDDFIEQHANDLFFPFQKVSALHLFIIFVVYSSFIEEVDDAVFDSVVRNENYTLWVSDMLNHYGISHVNFKEWLKLIPLTLDELESESIIIDYYHFLDEIGVLRELLHQIAEEVFFILFLNRGFLYQFNKQISNRSSKIGMRTLPQDISVLFKRDGVLKRKYIPIWARKAVFFRDRGKCSSCQKDISGLVSISNANHFDHIVPLVVGGLNDVSNLQLLCENCNLSKSGMTVEPSNIYERWY